MVLHRDVPDGPLMATCVRRKQDMFATVLHNLKSPENTGMIVRTHAAYGGSQLVIVGSEPWRFRKRSQAFSRKLEKSCEIVYLTSDDEFFEWCDASGFIPVGIEISETSSSLPGFEFPKKPAIIVGNEGIGLPNDFLGRCRHTVTIPQFGPVSCLNVAMSCGIALYELNRDRTDAMEIRHDEFYLTESLSENPLEPNA